MTNEEILKAMIPCNSQDDASTLQNPYVPNLYQVVEVIDEKIN